MRIKLIPTIIIIVIYVIISLFTYQNDAVSDGYTEIGFPFNFYNYSEGKLANPTLASSFGFSVKFFLIDLLLLIVVIFIVNSLIGKSLKSKTNNLIK